MRDEADLAGEIKAFRKKFKAENGKDPSRKDMNRYPAIAETYDAWLAIKSANSASTSTSTLTTSDSSLKRKSALYNSPRKRSLENRFDKDEIASTSMGPPPTTPSKKKPKKVTYTDTMTDQSTTFKTPTKKSSAAAAASPSSSIHDSGGSIVDVPSTPKQDSPTSPSTFASRWNHQKQKTVAQKSPIKFQEYESPRKIKELLSSFSSIHRTPTKKKDEEEEELIQKLTRGPRPAYTPRTKARKRLRGEVVITPEKAKVEDEQATSKQLTKKRRGMAATTTLRDFGIVPVAAPRGTVSGRQSMKEFEKERRSEKSVMRQELDDEGGEDDDDEDEILGPSPSVSRIVDRPVKSFQPLFNAKTEDASHDETQLANTEQKPILSSERGKEPARPLKPIAARDAITKSVDIMRTAEDEQDANIVVNAYRPFGRNNSSTFYDTAASDEEEEGMEIYNIAAAVDTASSPLENGDTSISSDEDASPVLNALTLNSPQLKKARRRQKMKAERDIRHLLGTEDSLIHLAEEDVEEETKAEAPKTNKVGPPIKGGKLMKGFRDVSNSKAEKSKSVTDANSTKKQRMILQNTRDQLGSDEDSNYGDHIDDDDEWASEVSSAEYGLGDGYMSDL